MDITTGREFPFTNPQDDRHLYPTPPSGFSYDIYDHLVADQTRLLPKQNVFSNKIHRLNKEYIRHILQVGQWLPNAHPGLVTTCDACGKTPLTKCFNLGTDDICLACANKV